MYRVAGTRIAGTRVAGPRPAGARAESGIDTNQDGPGQARVRDIAEGSLGFSQDPNLGPRLGVSRRPPSASARPSASRELVAGLRLAGSQSAGSQSAGSQFAGSQLSAGVGSPLGRRGFLVTRPDRRQDVQTFRCCARPSTKARTRCRFGCQTRRLALFAWLRRLPNWIPLLQISQTRDIDSSMGQDESREYRPGGWLASMNSRRAIPSIRPAYRRGLPQPPAIRSTAALFTPGRGRGR